MLLNCNIFSKRCFLIVYERRISVLHEEILAQTRQDIRSRLLQLAGYRIAPTDQGEGSDDSSRDTG